MLTIVRGIDKGELVLGTERLVLRPLRPDDITTDYLQGLNDEEVNRYLEIRRRRQTFEIVREFVVANLVSPGDFLFGVFLRDGRRLIGTVRLHDVSDFHFSAGIGVCLFAKDCWGQGYGLEAVRRVTQFAFETLGLHYIEAGSYEENRASIALFSKAGFEIHAVIRGKFRLEDRFAPVIKMGLINRNFDMGGLRADGNTSQAQNSCDSRAP